MCDHQVFLFLLVNLTLSENFSGFSVNLVLLPLQIFKTYLVLVNSTFVWLTSNTRFVFDFFALHKFYSVFNVHIILTMMVGLGGLEPPTSRLSGVRSNHLSYRPN